MAWDTHSLVLDAALSLSPWCVRPRIVSNRYCHGLRFLRPCSCRAPAMLLPCCSYPLPLLSGCAPTLSLPCPRRCSCSRDRAIVFPVAMLWPCCPTAPGRRSVALPGATTSWRPSTSSSAVLVGRTRFGSMWRQFSAQFPLLRRTGGGRSLCITRVAGDANTKSKAQQTKNQAGAS